MLDSLKNNVERLQAALVFYGELYNISEATPAELENIRTKREFVKKEILRLTLANKKLLREIEQRFERRGGHDA
jgi:hypothetical protein